MKKIADISSFERLQNSANKGFSSDITVFNRGWGNLLPDLPDDEEDEDDDGTDPFEDDGDATYNSYEKFERRWRNRGYWSYYIPEWAINYIYNADPTGLTKKEIKMVDDFIEKYGNPEMMDYCEDRFFTKSPEFGLPCMCYEYREPTE